ncbi:MAG: glutathione ABC transporter substrate-binding protein [Bacillota bacterium]
MKKVSILILMVFLVTALSFGVSAQEKVITYATSGEVVGLSPILTNDSASATVQVQVYETLFLRDGKTNEIKPNLATSYSNPDPNTWIIELRDDVHFHDGTKFNAEAVKFSFDRLRDPDVAAPRASLLEPVDNIEVVDEYTVKITTKYPYGPFLAALTHSNSAIVSPTAVEKYGDLMQNSCGTGPFKVEEWDAGNQLTLVKNENYWGGEVKIDKAVYKVVPEAATQVAMLETGEVDFIDAVPSEHLMRLEANPEIDIDMVEGTPIRYLGFNFEREEFNNRTLRRAIAHAIDREGIISTMNGLAYKSYGIIGPKVFGYTEEVEDYGQEYDPEKAKELLEQAGYTDGFETTIWTSSVDTEYMRNAEMIQAMLKEAGINADIRTLEWGAYLTETRKGNTDLFLLGWSNLTADGSELIYPNLHSDNIGGANRSFYDGADAYIEASRGTVDQEKRLEYLSKANNYLVDNAVWVPLYHQSVYVIYRDRVKGLTIQPNGNWYLKNVDVE